MKVRSLVFFAIAALLLAVVPPTPANAAVDAIFKANCKINHSAPDDPIVFRDMPGASHLHDFLGNEALTAGSTTGQLGQATSNCVNDVDQMDHSAYWAPALMKDGVPVATTTNNLQAYYTDGDGKQTITPFPYGLRVIAGDSKAIAPQPISVVEYHCSPGGQLGSFTEIPTCINGTHVVGLIHFPDCWDGVSLDSFDHKSHMAYSALKTGCPVTHPVRVPKLNMHVHWPATTGQPGSQYTLASGGQYSLHADFWNVWAPAALEQIVAQCLNIKTNCTSGLRGMVTGDIVFPLEEWVKP
jgi:hypothetical protein